MFLKKAPIVTNPNYGDIKSTWKFDIPNSIGSELLRVKNKNKKLFSDDDKEKAIECMVALHNEGIKSSRDTIKGIAHNKFPYPVNKIERAFGSWNNFIKACGLVPQYEAETPSEIVSEYFKECHTQNKALSFYEYGKIRGNNYTLKMKRLFNAGKKYASFKGELSLVALDKTRQESFLKRMV